MSYLVEQPPHCDLLRLSLVTGRFVPPLEGTHLSFCLFSFSLLATKIFLVCLAWLLATKILLVRRLLECAFGGTCASGGMALGN